MDNKKFLEQMECTGIVPVIKLENTDDAVNLARALYEGGIKKTSRLGSLPSMWPRSKNI